MSSCKWIRIFSDRIAFYSEVDIFGNLRVQISFSDSGYFNFGTTVIYDLYEMNIDGKSEKMNTWTVSPKLGLDFIF